MKELLLELAQKNTIRNKRVKADMFGFYNSMVGKSKYFPKAENPKTACGSCIQRVKNNIWKWYHYDETAPTYDELEFTGKLGIHNTPLYRIK